ncbi:hypothetical protein V6N12_038750 [Hibiscus sabdariffa]|uniref:Uncharacterized protein n=1 Tax=Hibiscus sabdariffa TaxID=183260 RepID=A0ABR2CAQ9_9ROSI
MEQGEVTHHSPNQVLRNLNEIHLNLTVDWFRSDVCNYTSVYCVLTLDNKRIRIVADIDLNHDDIVGYLPEEARLLTDILLFHINTNRFCKTIPHKFERLKRMFELDLSNNRFAGKFPSVVLKLPVSFLP